MTNIPKIIHYCWFGRGKMPELANKCIESWKKYLPDYEIREWNEDNFDVNIIPYTKEAYRLGKYAFVSDYARFWILYNYGGLYFDTDVEVIKPIDDIIAKGPFMGCENNVGKGATTLGVAPCLGVNPGLGLGVNPGLGLYGEILDYYKTLMFPVYNEKGEMQTVVHITSNILLEHGLKQTNDIQECMGIWIYPKQYFCPKDYKTGIIKMEKETVCIHHYTDSWHKKSKIYEFCESVFGEQLTKKILKVRLAIHRL